MNWKRFALAAFVIFVLANINGFVIHSVILHDDYAGFPNLLRTEQEVQGYIHFMTLGLLVYSLAFAWIYAQGISDTPWLGQGVRFGVAVWMMTSVPGFLTYYTVQPWPGMLVAKQIGLELVGVLILGVAVAFVHRK